jgi:hypothetical protein
MPVRMQFLPGETARYGVLAPFGKVAALLPEWLAIVWLAIVGVEHWLGWLRRVRLCRLVARLIDFAFSPPNIGSVAKRSGFGRRRRPCNTLQ